MNSEEKETANEESKVENVENLTEEQKKIQELEAKFAEVNDKYIRLYSEFENYKKRTMKEKLEFLQLAGQEVFKTVLPVLDDFERAMKANAEAKDVKTVNEGVSLVYQKLKTSLTQKGLEEMVSLGQEFNSDIHEAVTNMPAPTEEQKGKVIEEIEKGYLLNGKVIRFAKVIVGI